MIKIFVPDTPGFWLALAYGLTQEDLHPHGRTPWVN